MLKIRWLLLFVFLFASTQSQGWIHHGIPTTQVISGVASQSLQQWGGGFVVKQDSLSGIHFFGTDSFGGYIKSTTDGFMHQVITDRSFATAACDAGFASPGSCFGMFKVGTTQSYQGGAGGLGGMCISPANPTIGFMYYGGYVFKSTNISASNPDSITWVNTNQSPISSNWTKTTDNSNNIARMNGPVMACDPNNANHVLLAVGNTTPTVPAIWETTDGGTTWVTIAAIPSASLVVSYSIAFDGASGTTGSPAITKTVYIYTNGATAGVYATTDGEVTWNRISGTGIGGSPTSNTVHMVVCSDSTVYMVDAAQSAVNWTGALWTYNAPGSPSAWVSRLPSGDGIHSVACNPSNANHVAAVDNGGQLYTTTTGAAGFSSVLTISSLAAGDTPWLAAVTTTSLTPGDISVDSSDNILFNGGQGVWTLSGIPTSSFVWIANSKGITQPIGMTVLAPQLLTTITGAQDIGACTIIAGTPPPNCTAFEQIKSLSMIASVDVSKTDSTTTFARLTDDPTFTGDDFSGWSTKNYNSDINIFNDWQATVPTSQITTGGGTSTNVDLTGTGQTTAGLSTWVQGVGTVLCTQPTAHISGGGGQYTVGSCYEISVTDSLHLVMKNMTYSPESGGATVPIKFYHQTNPFVSWRGTFNIYDIQSVGGQTQITYDLQDNTINSGTLTNLTYIKITSTASSGINVDGDWFVKNGSLNTTNRTFILQDSGAPVGTYTGGGGVVNTWMPSGGSIAAASNTNIVQEGGFDYPSCTTDKGLTWSPVTNAGTQVQAVAGVGNSLVTGGPYSAGTTTIALSNGVTTGLANGTNIFIALNNGSLWAAKVSGAPAGGNVTLTIGVPPNRTVQTGAVVLSFVTGWQTTGNGYVANLAADWVQPNTFFAINTNAGLLKWTNCGATTVVNADTALTGGHWMRDFVNASGHKIKAVPGEPGHLFTVAGIASAPAAFNSAAFDTMWRTCNGNSNTLDNNTPPNTNSVVMHAVAKNFNPTSIGYGKVKPGSAGYPSILSWMWYDWNGVAANALWGLYESTDDPNHGNSGTGGVGTGTCYDTSAQFTGTITGTALVITGGLGTPGVVHVGDGIVGTGVTSETEIVSGSGLNWVVNKSQNVGPVSMTAGGTFHKITDWPSIFANGPKVMALPRDVMGDPVAYGPIYTQTGAGAFWGTADQRQ